MNRRLVVWILIWYAAFPCWVAAQGLEVSSPLKLSSRQEAVTYERFDRNLERCAMVVVHLDNDNVDFQGDVYSTQYRSNGEWWVWMVKDANWLTLIVPNYTPLRMEFNPLQSGKTYEVSIRPEAPKQLLTIVEPFHADLTSADASKYSRTDAQGRMCALVRIGLVLPEAHFTGAVHSKYLNSEWLVWLAPGSTSLTVTAPGYRPLAVQFAPVESAVTYLMTVYKAGQQAVSPQPVPRQPVVSSVSQTPDVATEEIAEENGYIKITPVKIEEEEEEEEQPIFFVVENDPEFPGGMEAMYKFLRENIMYPELAREFGITGKVYVTFVVERDGSIANPRVIRDIGGGCGDEAIRVIKSMPKWIPGKQRGKTVRVQYSLPITFNLQ